MFPFRLSDKTKNYNNDKRDFKCFFALLPDVFAFARGGGKVVAGEAALRAAG
jgi:hypothetical protein